MWKITYTYTYICRIITHDVRFSQPTKRKKKKSTNVLCGKWCSIGHCQAYKLSLLLCSGLFLLLYPTSYVFSPFYQAVPSKAFWSYLEGTLRESSRTNKKYGTFFIFVYLYGPSQISTCNFIQLSPTKGSQCSVIAKYTSQKMRTRNGVQKFRRKMNCNLIWPFLVLSLSCRWCCEIFE